MPTHYALKISLCFKKLECLSRRCIDNFCKTDILVTKHTIVNHINALKNTTY